MSFETATESEEDAMLGGHDTASTEITLPFVPPFNETCAMSLIESQSVTIQDIV